MQGYYEICRTQGQHVSERGGEVQHSSDVCQRQHRSHLLQGDGGTQQHGAIARSFTTIQSALVKLIMVLFGPSHLVARVKSSGDMKYQNHRVRKCIQGICQ